MPPEEKARMKSCRPLDMEAARGTGNFRNDIANDVMEAAGIEVRARRARPARCADALRVCVPRACSHGRGRPRTCSRAGPARVGAHCAG